MALSTIGNLFLSPVVCNFKFAHIRLIAKLHVFHLSVPTPELWIQNIGRCWILRGLNISSIQQICPLVFISVFYKFSGNGKNQPDPLSEYSHNEL